MARAGTVYQSKGRWFDGNLVRFHAGTIRPWGGWRVAPATDGSPLNGLAGYARHALGWVATGGVRRLAVGLVGDSPADVLVAVVAGVAVDITPVGWTTNGAQNTVGTSGAGDYGGGDYGEGLYGGGGLSLLEGDVWHLDTFGDYLVCCMTTDGQINVWDGDVAEPAYPLDSTPFPGTTDGGHPEDNIGVVVTPERFLVALGADGDARKIKWADQESFTVWLADPQTNQAGEWYLQTNGRIRCARRTKAQTLVWTDTDLHSMNYIGPPLVYAFRLEGEGCGIVGPNAVGTTDTRAFWMGRNAFFSYNGFVQEVPCSVSGAVFGDINLVQSQKITCVVNATYSEVTWFYPSALANENDRYVTFNYAENHWTTGELARACGIDRGSFSDNPVLVGVDGYVYEHEYGHSRKDEGLATFLPFLESGPIEVGEGDRVFGIYRILPDEKTLGNVRFSLLSAMDATGPETTYGPFTVAQPVNVRVPARQVRVRLEQDIEPADETDWRVGVIRLGVKAQGTR